MSQILQLNDAYKARWDEYVNNSPTGTFFHLSGWKDIIEKTFELYSIYLMALDNRGEIKGILPLFQKKDLLGRKFMISIPFSTYAGVCSNDEAVKMDLFNRAKEIAVENRVQYIEIRQLANEVYNLPTVKDFITMFLKLESDEDIIWRNALNAKARNKVRMAYKEGLTVDFGRDYLDDFYKVLSVNIRDLGSPNYPKLFLENILQEFGDDAGIFVVKYQERVIGGLFYICYKKVFLNPWSASLTQYMRLRPNDILYWEVIKYACRKGYEYFDFGRSPVNSGTFEFKKKWGAEPVQIQYQYFLNKTQKIPVVNAHTNKYQTLINLWKKMPLKVAEAVGPKLIKYVPEL